MAINFDKITKCQLIKVFGATECVICKHLIECWGEETQLPKTDTKVIDELLKGVG